MRNLHKKHSLFPFYLYLLILFGFTVYILLDAFIIPRTYATVVDSTETVADSTETTANSIETTVNSTETDFDSIISTDTTYQDDQISITLTQYREEDTDIYVADITLTDASLLKTALADDVYGKNITETTSDIAEENQAILAINGDFYSARNGYCIRNGTLYRNTKSSDAQQDLVIYQDGSVAMISEGDITAEELLQSGAQQVLSFGPSLITDGSISVSENAEVAKAKQSNPRTAFCQINELHYAMVVSDGRTSESAGLSLYQLATFLSETLHVESAYNLDGGGSATMYFQGSVVNQPTTNGNKISERKVSDIVYIG